MKGAYKVMKIMKKGFKIFCLLFLFLTIMSFFVYADNEQGGILRYGVSIDLITFDMCNYRSTVDFMFGSLVFDTLVTLDKNMDFVPNLATSWEKIDDLTWIFNLREGVKFTDGTPFNAEAVKISLERAAITLKGKRFQGVISTVNILNDYKVEVKLKEPNAPFFQNLTMPTAAILSPTALEKYGDDLFRNPVGTGFFKLEEWIPNTHVILTRNEDHWGGAAKLEKVIFTPIPSEASRVMAFKSGDLDVIENLPAHEVPVVQEDPNFKLMIVPQLRTVWVGFNCSDPILANQKVREAIAHAIDRRSIIEFTMENLAREANLGLLPPEVMKTDPPLSLNYDPELSKKLLAEAGYKDGLKLQLWSPEGRYAKDVEIAQVVQGQLKEVGIDVEVRIMEYGSYFDAINRGEQQLFILGWQITKNPDAFFRACFHSANESVSNSVFYANPEVDRIIDETAKLGDEEEINKNYYDLNKIIIEDAVVFPIYYTQMIYGINEKVEGFLGLPNETIDLSKTWIRD